MGISNEKADLFQKMVDVGRRWLPGPILDATGTIIGVSNGKGCTTTSAPHSPF